MIELTAIFVCHASKPLVRVERVDLAWDVDGMLWHDHSARGGDIVCTGPFSLHRHETSERDTPDPLERMQQAREGKFGP